MKHKIKHLRVRREVGAAAARIAASTKSSLAAMAEERERLHKRWRDLSDQSREAQRAYEAFMKTYSKGDAADHAIIAKAKREHPGLRFYEHDDHAPMLCTATGLALFEGDRLYGAAEYGAVLADAVNLDLERVEGFKPEHGE